MGHRRCDLPGSTRRSGLGTPRAPCDTWRRTPPAAPPRRVDLPSSCRRPGSQPTPSSTRPARPSTGGGKWEEMGGATEVAQVRMAQVRVADPRGGSPTRSCPWGRVAHLPMRYVRPVLAAGRDPFSRACSTERVARDRVPADPSTPVPAPRSLPGGRSRRCRSRLARGPRSTATGSPGPAPTGPV